MPQGLGRVLISREEIAARVGELGRAVAREHAGRVPLLVGVLKGAVVFMADLIRTIPVPIAMDFVGVSSYGAGARSSGSVRLTADLSMSIEGRAVVIVEDIVDSGWTLDYLRRNLETRHPRSLRTCALLDKVERRQVDVPLDYVGFAIPDHFVLGYGFDLGGLYRGLPDIHILEETARAART
jgi:hypoxanthine phosphoribosyltransferase